MEGNLRAVGGIESNPRPGLAKVITKGFAMKLRSLGMSVLMAVVSVSTVEALRAADEKPKAKTKEAQKLPQEVKEKAEAEEALPPGIVKFTTAPAAVQKTFKDEVTGGKIELLGKGTNDKGVFYKALIGIGTNNYEVAVGENGMLLEKILQMSNSEVAVENCPAPVMKTLKEEAKGAKIETIEQVAEGKRLHFVVDVVIQKSKYQIIVMDDGTLISKVIDYEKDEDTVPAPVEAKGNGKASSSRKN